ncbi:hypothetical protein CYMTET_21049, partial [Cymbomonas tetramitiformis]
RGRRYDTRARATTVPLTKEEQQDLKVQAAERKAALLRKGGNELELIRLEREVAQLKREKRDMQTENRIKHLEREAAWHGIYNRGLGVGMRGRPVLPGRRREGGREVWRESGAGDPDSTSGQHTTSFHASFESTVGKLDNSKHRRTANLLRQLGKAVQQSYSK